MYETFPPDRMEDEQTNLEVLDIPKSLELFKDDINDAVIRVQLATGFEITPDWWKQKVGNSGPTEEILSRFDSAFEDYVREQMGTLEPDKAEDPEELEVKSDAEILAEAKAEVRAFDKMFNDDDYDATRKQEFLEDLTDHLKSKYFSLEDNEEDEVKEAEKADYERHIMQQLFEKYPEEQRESVKEMSGVKLVSCGIEMTDEQIDTIEYLLENISQKIGEDTTKQLFEDLTIYVATDFIDGGGQALARQDAVIIDADKMDVALTEVEDWLDSADDYKKGDRANLVESSEQTLAVELDLVHELGHVLEYRQFGDYDRAFSEIDRSTSPTTYGNQSAREDFAESWLHYVYDGSLDDTRRKIIEQTIADLSDS